MADKKPVMGKCRLCPADPVQLENSHIIPDFVCRWLREQSVTGHGRTLEIPKRRTVRFFVKNLLCGNCEDLFQKWEDAFAKQIFQPIVEESLPISVPYDSWLFRFCLSVAWRVLVVGIDDVKSHEKSRSDPRYPGMIKLMQDAEVLWRNLLLDPSVKGQGIRVHLFPLGDQGITPDQIGESMRAFTQFGLVGEVLCHKEMLVYAKAGPVLIVVFLAPPTQTWLGGEIDPVSGVFEFRDYWIPHYFKERMISIANAFNAKMEMLPDHQKQKTTEAFELNLAVFKESPLGAALLADALEAAEQSNQGEEED